MTFKLQVVRLHTMNGYYSDSDGKCHDGWLLYNGAWYYFRKGEMLRNTYTPDGNWVGLDGVWA